MGKLFLYILLFLLVVTVVVFILGYPKLGYFFGFIFGSLAFGVGYVYSSKDDKYRNNYLNTDDNKRK